MDQEGVTKFTLHYAPAAPLPVDVLRELDAWRTLLYRLGLIGQDPARYGGVGFGNVSRRLDGERFTVTGTQTAHLPCLQSTHYSIVTACDVAANAVRADGPIAPSSESLTHDVIYRACPNVGYVFHVHSPAIWRQAASLGLPSTPADVPYGTPEMAQAVTRLLRTGSCNEARLFVMGGHEDGVFSFGATAEDAGLPLLAVFAHALASTALATTHVGAA